MAEELYLEVGKWIGVSEEEVWLSPFDSVLCFDTKREVIEDISSVHVDSRNFPKVTRVASGEYIYTVKDYATKRFGQQYAIIRLTKQNITHYASLVTKQLED